MKAKLKSTNGKSPPASSNGDVLMSPWGGVDFDFTDKSNDKQQLKTVRKSSKPAKKKATKTGNKILRFVPGNPEHDLILSHWDDLMEQHKSASGMFMEYVAIGFAVSRPGGIKFLTDYYPGIVEQVKAKTQAELERRMDRQADIIQALARDVLELKEELELVQNKQMLNSTDISIMRPTVDIVAGHIKRAEGKAQIISQPTKTKGLNDGTTN